MYKVLLLLGSLQTILMSIIWQVLLLLFFYYQQKATTFSRVTVTKSEVATKWTAFANAFAITIFVSINFALILAITHNTYTTSFNIISLLSFAYNVIYLV